MIFDLLVTNTEPTSRKLSFKAMTQKCVHHQQQITHGDDTHWSHCFGPFAMATLQNFYTFKVTTYLNQVTNSELLLRVVWTGTATGSGHHNFGEYRGIERPAVATWI